MRSPALLAMTLALLTSAAQAQIAPVLTIHFDKDFHGVGPQGAVVRGTPVGKPELAEGKFGRALKTGSPTGFVDYPTKGILNPRRGTIEMWVCPVDWLPDDGKFHAFFAVRGQGALYLYKYFSGTRLLMLTGNDVKGPFTSSQFPVNDWKPGQWHHLAGSWSPQGVLAYVDGKPADKQPLAGLLPTALDPTFRIGDQPWQFPRATTSLIDEVRIYDRTLTPAQIAAHFAGNYQYAVPLSKETVHIDIEPDPSTHQAEVRVDTGGADVDDAGLELQLAIVPAGGSFPDQPVRAKFDGGQAVVILPLSGPGVASGAYQVVARIVRNGMPVVEASRALIIPETSWLGSTVGRADVVLPPWTPLKVSTAKPDKQIVAIGCWGRSYEFQHAAFPSQITSAGEPLLARPIALRFHHGEQDSTWQQQSLTAVRASPTTALLQGVLAASGP